jgi:hypothetical protein
MLLAPLHNMDQKGQLTLLHGWASGPSANLVGINHSFLETRLMFQKVPNILPWSWRVFQLIFHEVRSENQNGIKIKYD